MKSLVPIGIRRALSLIEPAHRRALVLLIGLCIIAAALESIGVGAVFMFIKFISEPETVAQSDWAKHLLSNPLLPPAPGLYVALAAVIAVLYAVKNGLVGIITYLKSRFLAEVGASLAARLIGKYLNASYQTLIRRNSAELVQNVNNLSFEISGFILEPLIAVFTEGLVIFAIVAVLLAAEPGITILAAATVSLVLVAFYVAFRARFRRWGHEIVELNRESIKTVQECISSIKEIQVIGCQDHFQRQFEAIATTLARVRCITQTVTAVPRLLLETMMVTATAGLVGLIVASGRPVESAVAVLGLYAIAGFRLIPSFNRILLHMSNVKMGRAVVERLYPDLAEGPRPPAAPDAPVGGTAAAGPEGRAGAAEITAESLTYAYPGSARPALVDVSFAIRRGESIGLVGSSGAGKSTLADVILGLLPPTGGIIRIDGIPAAGIHGSFAGRVAYVPQSVILLDMTLRRNIAFGLDDADIDDGLVWKAIRLAALDGVVAELPEGLDTGLGERGARLSGGQRQRVGIARALYRGPELIVFDEATSALDSETEREITMAIDRLKGLKTTITIAHRLSTIRHCDRIFFMEAGRIVESGAFEELRRRCPAFARMVHFAELTGRTIDGPDTGGEAAAPTKGDSTARRAGVAP